MIVKEGMNLMNYTKEIPIKKGEYWWGGNVEDGWRMPFDPSFKRNLYGNLLYNQGAPLLLSNKGRIIWSDEPFEFSVEADVLKIVSSSEITFSDNEGSLKSAFGEASSNYFPSSQQMPDISFFSLPQFNTWMEMPYYPEQEAVLTFAKDILKHGFPPGVFIIDDGWQENFGNWVFHLGRFPNPKAMVEELKELGFKVMLWICPFVSPDSYTFRMLNKKGYLIRDKNDKPVIREWWNGYSGILDCSNKSAVEWLQSKMDSLKEDYGIDGFKMDGGDPQYYKLSDRCKKNITPNEHCLEWAKIGLNYPFNEYRACWKLGGQPLVQRLSDKNHSWTALKSLVPNAIAQGLLGYTFICPDMIGGGQYEDLINENFTWDQELFVRYAQCSALFPMMQFSTAPWRVLDEIHLNYCLEAIKVHNEFAPTMIELAKNSAKTGEPIIRHMAFEFDASEFIQIKDQFMLGENILVAPVLERRMKEREIIFPPGTWIGDDGTKVNGPCKVKVQTPLSRLPWYRSEERRVG